MFCLGAFVWTHFSIKSILQITRFISGYLLTQISKHEFTTIIIHSLSVFEAYYVDSKKIFLAYGTNSFRRMIWYNEKFRIKDCSAIVAFCGRSLNSRFRGDKRDRGFHQNSGLRLGVALIANSGLGASIALDLIEGAGHNPFPVTHTKLIYCVRDTP